MAIAVEISDGIRCPVEADARLVIRCPVEADARPSDPYEPPLLGSERLLPSGPYTSNEGKVRQMFSILNA